MSGDQTIRAVIFDVEGVLTDSKPLLNAAAVAMFAELGREVIIESSAPFAGADEDRYLGGIAEKYGIPIDLSVAKKRTCELYLELVATRLHAFAGACELVCACRSAGLKIAATSNADHLKVKAALRKIGLPAEIWDLHVTAEDVSGRKPESNVFTAVAHKLDLKPEQCVVVVGTLIGVQTAKAVGMRCVAVAQTLTKEHLQAADLVREKISEVSLSDLMNGADAGAVVFRLPPAPQPKPWGFWPTIGFSLAIAVAFVAASQIALVAFVFVTHALNIGVSVVRLQTNGLLWGMSVCASAPAVIGCSWLFARVRKGVTIKEYFALRRVRLREMAEWCLALLVWLVLSDWLSPMFNQPTVPDVMIQVYRTACFPPLLWFGVVIAAPLSEEIFFRGFLFKGLLHSWAGGAGAVLLSALLWAAIHTQYDSFGVSVIFVTGLLFGLARLKSGSIYPSLLMHAMMNLLAMIQVAALTS